MDILTEAAGSVLRWGRPDGALVSRAAVVTEARKWVGTPFVHQHEVMGVGVDCGGLVRAVSVALGLIPQNYREMIPARLRGYARQPEGDLGERLCDFYWHRIDVRDAQPGDVILMRWSDGPAQHAAIAGEARGALTLIHALGPNHPAKVVEHRIDKSWVKRMVCAYKIPGVA